MSPALLFLILLLASLIPAGAQVDALDTIDHYDPTNQPSPSPSNSGRNLPYSARSESARWEVLDGCVFKGIAYHDADSFHVVHQGSTHIFRLYFVDAPEVDKEFPDRVREQAKYFGVTQANLFTVAEQATHYTEQQLSRPFRVVTRWQDARGNSRAPRYYALVFVDGETLGERLVSQGFARIHGAPADYPPYKSAQAMWERLAQLEREARAAQRGIWQFSKKAGKP